MHAIEKIDAICKNILKLSDVDIESAEKLAKDQSGFSHPLNMKRTEEFRELGEHNSKVIASLKQLRQILIDGAPKS